MVLSKVSRLKKRADFLRVAACQRKAVMPTMIVQLAKQPVQPIPERQGEVTPKTVIPPTATHNTACQQAHIQNADQQRQTQRATGRPALPPVRVGFTASRKVGNAVKRNRARRRLRAVVQAICPAFFLNQQDIVVIARSCATTAPFDALLHDFRHALKRLELKPL